LKFQLAPTIEKIQSYIQLETYLVLWVLIIIGYLFYRFFLKEISIKRHTNLKRRFNITSVILTISSCLSAAHWVSYGHFEENIFFLKLTNILAFFALLVGTVSVIKLAQILTYLYLFFMNMSVGIPRLVTNLFTVVFSLFILSFLASEIFAVNLSAMLATSAVFSLVLGLALQDTLGNLFSGVAMQIGKPFTIGDWIEISFESKKWVGQIQEITWRATFMTSFSDEWIMIPNKNIAQSQIVILSNNQKNLRHSQTFRIRYSENIGSVKRLMLMAILKVPLVLQDPEPRILITETNESWLVMKVFYSISDFAMKYRVGDQVISEIVNVFQNEKIDFALNTVELFNSHQKNLD